MIVRALIAFIGMLCIGLVPFVPKILEVRIRVLRWLGLPVLANWHENHFDSLVVFGRVLMAVVGMIMLFISVRMV